MKKTETIKRLGVVGTWVSPAGVLGGALPPYLADDMDEALELAARNERLLQFAGDTEQWLCEITIKPIRKLTLESKKIFV